MHLYLKNLWICIHTIHTLHHRGREGAVSSRTRRKMIEVDLASRLTRFDCGADADCEPLVVTNASLHPFPKQETQSVPDHSRKLELVPTDQLQFIVNPITEGDFQHGYLSQSNRTELPSGWLFAHPGQVSIKGAEDQGLAGTDSFG